jgi:predicted transcriptional regulator
MIDRKELRKQLPYRSIKKIADKAGCSRKSVWEYLTYNTNSPKVALAVVEVLEELKVSKNEFENRLQAALS